MAEPRGLSVHNQLELKFFAPYHGPITRNQRRAAKLYSLYSRYNTNSHLNVARPVSHGRHLIQLEEAERMLTKEATKGER